MDTSHTTREAGDFRLRYVCAPKTESMSLQETLHSCGQLAFTAQTGLSNITKHPDFPGYVSLSILEILFKQIWGFSVSLEVFLLPAHNTNKVAV